MDTRTMNHHLVERAIDEIERCLLRDDPSLALRLATLEQHDTRHDALVFSMLATSAILLAVGVATLSWVAWLTGAIAFTTSSLVDSRYERRFRQPATVEARIPPATSSASPYTSSHD